MTYGQMAHIVTHTHTHTINFVNLWRTALRRWPQWVSASWQAIRRLAELDLERTPAMVRRAEQSLWVSRRNGCWCLPMELIPQMVLLPTGTQAEDSQSQAKMPVTIPLLVISLVLFPYVTADLSYIKALALLWIVIIAVPRLTTSTAPDCRKAVA